MRIVAHTLVKNEDRFFWYSLMAAAPFIDEILLWDNGSTDGTLEVIKEARKTTLLKDKVKFRSVGTNFVHEKEIRQEMLNETHGDWVFMLDGDEIWWDTSLKKIVKAIRTKGETLESIVVPTVNLVGDMYHRIEDSAGRYVLAGRVGHLNLRAFNRKIPGLSSRGEEWGWGWVDGNGMMIQDRDPKKILYIEAPYLHATHLPRSGKDGDKKAYRRNFKKKVELGLSLPKDYYYPEVFFRPKPVFIPSPWKSTNLEYKFKAFFQTPLRKIHRKFLSSKKVGY